MKNIKNVLLYFIGFTILFFIAPAICTVVPSKTQQVIAKEETSNSNIIEQENNANSTNDEKKKIKLLHSQTGNIEELDLDEYLYGVVSSEMPANFEIEALKAQAVVARTYTIYQTMYNSSKHTDADICDNYACCQAWISKEERMAKWGQDEAEGNWNKIVEAVNSTTGKIVAYNGQPINAFFHANSGGTTELPVNVWGGSGLPYLQVVQTAGEEGYTQYSSEVVLKQEELINKIKEKYEDIQIDFNNDEDVKIIEHTDSNRVKTVKFGNHELSGVETRTLLGLKSTNFEIKKENNQIKFLVKGYGHGVGMSQTGANTMAKQGNKCEEIIKHFYVGIEIKDINSI